MNSYIDRLVSAYRAGTIQPDQVAQVDVEHDQDCPRLIGGTCTCRPAVTVLTSATAIALGQDGTANEGKKL